MLVVWTSNTFLTQSLLFREWWGAGYPAYVAANGAFYNSADKVLVPPLRLDSINKTTVDRNQFRTHNFFLFQARNLMLFLNYEESGGKKRGDMIRKCEL